MEVFSDRAKAAEHRRMAYGADESCPPGEKGPGTHVTYGLDEYCQNLQLNFQNNDATCDLPSRRLAFQTFCSPREWDPAAAQERLYEGIYFGCELIDPIDLAGSYPAHRSQFSKTGYLHLRIFRKSLGRSELFVVLKVAPALRPSERAVQLRYEVWSTMKGWEGSKGRAATAHVLESGESLAWTQKAGSAHVVELGQSTGVQANCRVWLH